MRLETRPSEIRDTSHDAELQLIVSDTTREPSLRVGPNSTTISNDNGRPKLRFHANGGDHKTGSITYETNPASLVFSSNTGGEMQIHNNAGQRIASFGLRWNSVNEYIETKLPDGSTAYYGAQGAFNNRGNFSITSHPLADQNANQTFTIEDVEETRGMQLANLRGHCNLRLTSRDPATSVTKGGRIRLETRENSKYSSTNTTEFHFLDNDGNIALKLGNNSSRLNSLLDCASISTNFLFSNTIDMTASQYTVNVHLTAGALSGSQVTLNLTLRKFGKQVFFSFSPPSEIRNASQIANYVGSSAVVIPSNFRNDGSIVRFPIIMYLDNALLPATFGINTVGGAGSISLELMVLEVFHTYQVVRWDTGSGVYLLD